jgi:beta-lactamase class A/peptidoglycan/xylan/chitin deacetylase (PgdA/CDA1 family)
LRVKRTRRGQIPARRAAAAFLSASSGAHGTLRRPLAEKARRRDVPLCAIAVLTVLSVPLAAQRIAEIAQSAQGRVGASAELLETGKSLVSFHAREHFPMQSVYKLPIAMAVLRQVDRGALHLDAEIRVDQSEYIPKSSHSPLRDTHPNGATVTLRELIRLAVSESDGTASDVLLRLLGGAQGVMVFLRDIGVHDVQVEDTEKKMAEDNTAQYRNWATPDGAVTVLRDLLESSVLSPGSRDLLLRFMTESTTFPTRIKGLLPVDTVVAHKTGSSGTHGGVTAATNDIGIVTLPDGRHIAIAVFVSDAKADDSTRDRVIARIARAAWDSAEHGVPTSAQDAAAASSGQNVLPRRSVARAQKGGNAASTGACATCAVAITIDDLPRGGDGGGQSLEDIRTMTIRLLRPSREQHIPLTGFVHAGVTKLTPDGQRQILDLWLDAGADLGNHTYSHADLNTTPVAQYEQDILKDDAVLRPILKAHGRKIEFFRYPFLHAGASAEAKEEIAEFLAAHGYRNAPVTLDNSDYMFAFAYLKPELSARVRAEYIAYLESVVAFFERRSIEVAGREFPQILLLHASELNSEMMPQILEMFRQRGYRFVSLNEALNDAAYQMSEQYVGRGGFSWIHRWSMAKNMPGKAEPDEPEWVRRVFQAR